MNLSKKNLVILAAAALLVYVLWSSSSKEKRKVADPSNDATLQVTDANGKVLA